MRKFKAFTLIELLVVIGIMGILMTGIIQLIAPMHSTATNTKVLNEQRNVEESIASYIGENVRYASNLLIVEEGSIIGEDDGHGGITNAVTVNSPENAITAFFKYGPANMDGIIADTTDNRKKVHVIKFDRNSAFNFENNGYYGRLITNKAGMTGLNYAVGTNGLLTNTEKQYVVFGNGYYGNGDYSMSVGLNEDMHALGIQITSEYWYSNAKLHGKSNQTYANPVIFTYQLRNFGVGSSRYIFKCVSHSGVSGDGHTLDASVSGGAIYFVYLDQEGENLPTDPTLAQTPPHYGANTDEITHNGTNATGPAASTSTSGSSSTSSSSGSTGANGRPGSASGNGGNQGHGNGSGSTGNSNNNANINGPGNNNGNNGNGNGNGNGNNNGNGNGHGNGNNNGNNGNGHGNNNSQPAEPANTGRNGAAAPPASVSIGNTAVASGTTNGTAWSVQTDSNIWSTTVNGDVVTFTSSEYGTVSFKVEKWGSIAYIYQDSTNTLNMNWGNGTNSDVRQFESKDATAINFWKSYGIQFNF